jgi:IS5 family transposase
MRGCGKTAFRMWYNGDTGVREGHMAQKRYKEQGTGSFFGEYLYERTVPDGHFLRQLERLIDWEVFSEKLVRLYRGQAKVGRPPYNPSVILKMLLLAYLYDLSERRTEAFVNDSLSAKYFLGLAIDEPAPDHSTLTAFKRRIVRRGGEGLLEELLIEVVQAAQREGVAFGSIQVVDSTHTVADVNVAKEDRRRKREGKPPRDNGARWGGKRKRRRGKKGQVGAETEYFYGYKLHNSLNAEAEMITSIVVTGANGHDGKQFPELVRKDGKLGLPVQVYSADRGYDDGNNHYLLEDLGMQSAIHLNRYRTEKKDGNKGIWLALKESDAYRAGQRERYKIERKYGEAKENHGLRRCRYVGWIRYAIQAYLTAIVLNLKRMVRVVTGVSFRGDVKATT